MTEENTKSKWDKLKEPIEYKWRVQSTTQWNCTLVAYIDARDVEGRLDEILSPENWQNEYKTVGNQMLSGIGIVNSKGEWVWKYDGGTESNIEKEKGLLSDSFKRSAVKWGIGRFLYRKTPYKLPAMAKVKADGSAITDRNGKPMFVPAHDPQKYGQFPAHLKGIVYKLEIRNVNDYIWKFLKPLMESRNKQ